MFKTGIYNLDQLTQGKMANFSKKRKEIAIDLYAKIQKTDLENKEKLEEIILKNFAFSDGTYKRTHSSRFDDFNKEILETIKEMLEKEKYIIHDAAISDGRTSCEFFTALKKEFGNIELYASDKNLAVYIFESKKNKKNKIVKDEKVRILQIIFSPFVLNVFTPKKAKLFKIKKAVLFPLNYILTKILLTAWIQKIFIPIDAKGEKMELFSKETLSLKEKDENFHLVDYSLFEEKFADFDIVRAMNVVNPTYFSDKEVETIAKNLKNSLKENGLLVIGSNNNINSSINGDIFIKKDKKLHSMKKFNRGVPFREIFLEI